MYTLTSEFLPARERNCHQLSDRILTNIINRNLYIWFWLNITSNLIDVYLNLMGTWNALYGFDLLNQLVFVWICSQSFDKWNKWSDHCYLFKFDKGMSFSFSKSSFCAISAVSSKRGVDLFSVKKMCLCRNTRFHVLGSVPFHRQSHLHPRPHSVMCLWTNTFLTGLVDETGRYPCTEMVMTRCHDKDSNKKSSDILRLH